jgi:hypothetical protein
MARTSRWYWRDRTGAATAEKIGVDTLERISHTYAFCDVIKIPKRSFAAAF